jgi:hypothetical protein
MSPPRDRTAAHGHAVHDDVVDGSPLRRGFFSINALWKNKVAVLVGRLPAEPGPAAFGAGTRSIGCWAS